MDADFENRKEIEQKLGTPRQLTHKIMAEYALLEDEIQSDDHISERTKVENNLRVIRWIVAGLFALPIGIPLMIALGWFLLFYLIITLIPIFINLAIFVAGFSMSFFSLQLLSTIDWAVGCFYLGLGVSTICIGILLVPYIFMVVRWIIKLLTNFIKKIRNRAFRNNPWRHKNEKI